MRALILPRARNFRSSAEINATPRRGESSRLRAGELASGRLGERNPTHPSFRAYGRSVERRTRLRFLNSNHIWKIILNYEIFVDSSI